MIKHLFLDMDGTLLNSEGIISNGTVKLLKKMQIPLTLVSARAPMEMEDTISKLDLNSIHVAFNGGLIYEMNNGKKMFCIKNICSLVLQEN
ncbi:hypothetical protein HMPREF1983_01198 [Gemella bergeri ATCC 700627]|uniref:Haloacid dehalogenase-like hydrolase n=1 Tax=Gemella bergeri ATCC 700627 TaxID=1321820 RepID=U2Q2X9_9BACL|nr:HAD hydrolase family protein [Gemella bergeri]ERK57095.1 hypothetical protein HMPREF1983_01198 [Gemella bergeri ATCC 700627]